MELLTKWSSQRRRGVPSMKQGKKRRVNPISGNTNDKPPTLWRIIKLHALLPPHLLTSTFIPQLWTSPSLKISLPRLALRMSRRPNPAAAKAADKAAANQAVIKSLLKLPGNKICADCKRNKLPRWASWNLGLFICIRSVLVPLLWSLSLWIDADIEAV